MKTTISTPILAAILALALNACTSAPTRPDWLSGDTARYSSAKDLLGRGEAPTLEQAKDRARADVAKIFEVAVNEFSEDVRQFSSSSDADKVQSGSEAKVSRTTLTHTDRVLQGVRIAETWQDPKSLTYFALAVLPRSQAAAGLRQEIEGLDAATRGYLDQARDTRDLLDKIAAAQRALQAQVERDGYQQTLKVVDRSGQGLPSEWSIARLRADGEDLRQRLHIVVRVPPTAPTELRDIADGAVSAAGFKTVPDSAADYVLDTQANLADPVFREGWYWVTGEVAVQLRERSDGRIRGIMRWPIKASAQDTAMAQRRAWDQVGALLKKELGDALTGITAGSDQP